MSVPVSTQPNAEPPAGSFDELKPACQVLILHDRYPAYLHAANLCRRLMDRFATDLDFGIKSWNIFELADPDCARHAARTAAAADIVMLAMIDPRTHPELDRWLAFDFTNRLQPDGLLAVLLDAPSHPSALIDQFLQRFGQAAVRLGMDFLSVSPVNTLPGLEIPPESDASSQDFPLAP